MTKHYKFFDLVDVIYSNAVLTVRIAELVEGAPDGYIGTPLVIDSQSKQFKVSFDSVAEFRSSAEPCFSPEGIRRNMTDFLFECFESEYLSHTCPFGVVANENVRHFVVFTESVVLEVLCPNDPKIES